MSGQKILSLVKCFVLVAQSRLTLCDRMDCSLPGSSVQGILRARILEWAAMPFSRSFWPRDQTQVSRNVGRFFNIWATREYVLQGLKWGKQTWWTPGRDWGLDEIRVLLFFQNHRKCVISLHHHKLFRAQTHQSQNARSTWYADQLLLQTSNSLTHQTECLF